MKREKAIFVGGLAVLLLAGLGAESTSAQRRVGQAHPPRAERQAERRAEKEAGREDKPAKREENLNRGQGNARGMMGLPPKWLERVREMSPEEQDRFLRNNAHFRGLPPERQAQIRENLRKWNSLTPEQRNEIRDRGYVWEHLTPEQRDYLRNQLLPKWKALAPDRKQVIHDRMRELRGLSEAEREARLNDPAFLRGLDPNEQQILLGLSRLRLGTAVP